MFYIGEAGYYEGDKISITDIEVTQRPDSTYVWDNGWVVDKAIHNAMIDEKLDALERYALIPRGAREAWIAQCKQIAASQGLTDAQAIATNPFYAKLIDQNNAAIALRAQRLK